MPESSTKVQNVASPLSDHHGTSLLIFPLSISAPKRSHLSSLQAAPYPQCLYKSPPPTPSTRSPLMCSSKLFYLEQIMACLEKLVLNTCLKRFDKHTSCHHFFKTSKLNYIFSSVLVLTLWKHYAISTAGGSMEWHAGSDPRLYLVSKGICK